MEIRDWLERLGLGQYAEPFESLGIQPHEIPQLSEADLAELGVASLVHRRRILQGAVGAAGSLSPASPGATAGPISTEPAQPLAALVLTRFPFPIAFGYRKVVEPESAAHVVDCVFYTYTAILRFSALTFLGQFLSGPGQNPNAAKALRWLQSPTLESWLTVATTLGKHLFPPLPGAGLSYPPFAAGGPFSPGLAAAVRQLSKLQRDGIQVHEQLRGLRNARAHGTPWDEAECARQLPGLRTLLEAVLERFAPLGEIQLLRRSPAGLIRLVGATEPFPEEAIAEPRIEDLFEASDTLLLGPDGALLPLYPLFLAPDAPLPEGYTEPLLSFDGHGKTTAMYLGVRSWTARRDTLDRYLDLLRAKEIDPRFTKADLSPWGVTDWARETSRGLIENLTGVKYFPEVYQERRAAGGAPRGEGVLGEDGSAEEAALGVDDVVARWLDRGREGALILAAEAGSGKTSLFCRLAEHLLTPERGDTVPSADPTSLAQRPATAPDCVLLLLGGALRGRTTLFERIRDGLGFSDDPARGGLVRFDELLAAWQAVAEGQDLAFAERRILILIDALNEAEDPKRLFEELSGLAADAAAVNVRAGRPWVRLLVSVRAERIETLLARWGEASDTPFLQHPRNFAHFPDPRGRQVPYLGLRRFTSEETEAAHGAAQRGPGPHCPASWGRLAPGTRELLRHPLMLALFHRAYAGVEQPPALTGADTLWDAWLARTFDPAQGGSQLERYALDLADDCIDGGQDQIPPELAETWRRRWQAELGNDPVRIAAGLDPLERLAEAGILRRIEGGGLDWVSDSLAEQVLSLALRRRDPGLSESSLAAWLALPVSRRLDSALSRVGAAIWRAGRPLELLPVLGAGFRRGRDLMTEILLDVAPRGLPGQVEAGAADFAARLGQLVEVCIAKDDRRWIAALKNSLLWDLDARLADRWGYGGARLGVARHALSLAEHLKALEPENTQYLRDLSISYNKLGDLDGRRDPAAARDWFEQGLEIARRLAALEPENTEYLRDLSLSYNRLGDLDGRRDPAAARDWFEQGLAIARRLAALEPENTQYLRDLSISYNKLGDLDGRRDPAAARDWFEQGLEIRRRLAALEPENTQYLRDLSISYDRLGDLDGRRDPAAARDWFEQGLEIARRLAALEPENTEYLRDLSLSYNRLGDLDGRRDPAAARDWFEQGLAIARRLVALEPENTQYLRDLSISYNKLGDLDGRRDPAAARDWFEQGLEIRRRLAALEPENTQYLRDLSISYERLGDLDGRRDPAAARDWFEQGLEIARRLAALEPENTGYLRDLGISCWKMGDTERSRAPAEALTWYRQAAEHGEGLVALQPDDGQYLSDLRFYCDRAASLVEGRDPKAARPWLERGVELGRALVGLDPSTLQRLNLSRWLVRLGNVGKRLGVVGADGPYREALRIREVVVESEPDNHEAWGLVSSALGSIAEWYLEQGDLNEELAYSERANAAMERAAALEPDDPDVQYGLACTRARLGHVADALAALARSVDLGNTDADWAAQDQDLCSLRELPEFAAILARMRGAATSST